MNDLQHKLVESTIYSSKQYYNIDILSKAIPEHSTHHITQTNMQIPVTRLGKETSIAATLYAIDQAAPCVIYMHGNGCDRAYSSTKVKEITNLHCHLFIFDYVGNGLSGDGYLSDGYFERDDVNVLISELSKRKDISNFILYGWSTGAVVTLMYMSKYQNKEVIGIICDSTSSDDILQLKELINLLHKKRSEDEKSALLMGVTEELMKKYGINLKELCPLNDVGKMHTPILFIYGTKDVLVLPHHSLDLYNAYGGKDKKLVPFEGGHNDYKPQHISDEINAFITRLTNKEAKI